MELLANVCELFISLAELLHNLLIGPAYNFVLQLNVEGLSARKAKEGTLIVLTAVYALTQFSSLDFNLDEVSGKFKGVKRVDWSLLNERIGIVMDRYIDCQRPRVLSYG